MAAPAGFRVRGYAELARGTRQLAGEIAREAPDEFANVAERVADTVGAELPTRTGALAGSVSVERQSDAALVTMGEGVDYAHYVEFGGRGHPTNPGGNYLLPTALDAEPLLVAAAEEVANREIGGMAWPSP